MSQGQIQVGACHQARLPTLQLDVKPDDMPESCDQHEVMTWRPDAIGDTDLLMYLRAARSMAAFVGWCDGGSTDDGCAAASMDETTVSSLNLLHEHDYNTSKALQALVKIINPKSVEKRWTDEDAKKFVRGLKQHGKNFFKIRRDILPSKETAELVEYYYLWKKTPAASNTRPHRRHRRPTLRRQAPTPTQRSTDDVEESSASEESENESEDESERIDVNRAYTCNRCCTTKSKNWYHTGKNGVVFCTDCRLYIHKYNDGAILDDNQDQSPFLFRPVKESHDLDDKLTSDGKESSSCPETTSEEGRAEERESPSADSVWSSGNNSSVSRENHTAEAKPSGSPSESCTDDCSNYGNENESVTPEDEPESSEFQREKTSVSPSTVRDFTTKDKIMDGVLGQGRSTDSEEKEKSSSGRFAGPLSSTIETFKMPPLKTEPHSVDNEPDSGTDLKPSVISYRHEIDHSGTVPRSSENWLDSKADSLLRGPSWSESKSRDDIKPARAVASVAPTPLNKTDRSSESSLTPSFHHPLSSRLPPHPPPPLAPIPRVSSHSPLTSPVLHDVSSSGILGGQFKSLSERSFYPDDLNRYDPLAARPSSRDRSSSRAAVTPTARSRSPSLERLSDCTSEDDERPRIPSPESRPTKEECYRSKNAIFIKRWYRGYNSCSRCDFEYSPTPDSRPTQRREEKRDSKSSTPSLAKSSNTSLHKDRRPEIKREDDRPRKMLTPPENRTCDAQITSALMGAQHLSQFGPTGPERFTPRGAFSLGHDPTPALRQLSEYARPHIGGARDVSRLLPYDLPGVAQQPIDPYFRIPGIYQPGSREREVLELEMERDKRERERDAWEREVREMQFVEKIKMEIAKQPGLDRLLQFHSAAALDPHLAEFQRRYNMSLPPGALPNASPHIPGVYSPASLTADLLQRERERIGFAELVRTSQEQFAATAGLSAGDSSAVHEIYRRYAQDPVMLQSQLNAYLALTNPKLHETEMQRMMEASHLVYHFARADPLASAAGGSSTSAVQTGSHPPHTIPPGHHLLPSAAAAAAREQEQRLYMEMLSRPPYNSDPAFASHIAALRLNHQEVLQHQLEGIGGGPSSLLLH